MEQSFILDFTWPGHECACEQCRSDFPTRMRATFNASRDVLKKNNPWPKSILIDGVQLPEIMAAKVGPCGWVMGIVRPPGSPRVTSLGKTLGHGCCRCGKGVCSFYIRGKVEIEYYGVPRPA